MDEGQGCGALHAFYVAARRGDVAAMRTRWPDVEQAVYELDARAGDRLEAAVTEGDPETARALAADLLFADRETPTLDGPLATALGTGLFAFGYVAAFVLFFRARSRESVVRRLRWAYRTVGVDVRDTESADSVERTVFRCPYRTLGAGRWGQRRVCHDVLDRVDDGYVSFLARHRGLDYDRPMACTASECCYSVVADRG